MRTIHLMLFSLVLVLSAPATAATIVVDTVVDTIDESDGDCSLREALINAANNDQSGSRNCTAGDGGTDIIVFNGLPTNATIALTGGVLPAITGDLEILGPDLDNPGRLTIDAQNASRILEVTGGRLTVSGLTLTNGTTDKEDEPGGAMHISGGADVSLQDLFITDSATEGVNSPGGAIYAVNAAQLRLSNVQMVRNQAQAGGGGAIFVTGTPLSVVDSVLGQNAASGRGGAIHAVGNQGSITSSFFLQNSTSGDSSFGGALFMDGSALVMTDTELTNNTTSGVDSHGGAVYLRNATLTVSGGIFDSNGVSGGGANGGAISTVGAEVNLSGGCQLIGNSTLQGNGWGGAMRIGTGNLEMDNCSISNNRTQGENAHGGAIYVITGNATILNSQIVDNETQGAGAQGGGLRVRDGNLTVENSLVQNNSTAGAGARGGGMYHRNGQSRLTRVEVISNTTAGLDAHGAGVYLLESDLDLELGRIENNRIDGSAVGAGMGLFSGNFEIDGVTFSANRGTGSGGAIHVADGPLRIVNSTISANEVSTGTGAAVFGNRSDVELLQVTVVDNINPPGNLSHLFVTGSEPDARASLTLNNSLVIGNRCGAGTLSALNVAGSLVTDASCTGQVVPAEALAIEPLADNGGFAPTYALSAGSIAINAAGNCPVDFSVTEDQRGLPRPGDGTSQCDVGAYERQSPQDPVDLQASLLINPAAAQVGQTLSGMVDITNPSTRWVSGVEVGLDIGNALLIQNADFSVGEIDAGFETWTIGLLAPQQTVSLALTVELAASGGREVVVSLLGDQPDPDTSNNLASQTVLEAQPSVNLLVNTVADNQVVDGLCSLREAMLNAENADQSGSIDCLTGGFASNTIEFHPDLIGGTIVLSGQQLPTITTNLDIIGPVPGDPGALIIDANELSRHLFVDKADSIRLADMTLSRGQVPDDGGSIFLDRVDQASLERMVLINNSSSGDETAGGALWAVGSQISVTDSVIKNNEAALRGGAMAIFVSELFMTGSTVANNSSVIDSGGIYAERSSGVLRNTTISGNRHFNTTIGQGMSVRGGHFDLEHVTFAFNRVSEFVTASGLSVAGWFSVPGSANLRHSLFVGERCSQSVDSTVNVSNSVATQPGCGIDPVPEELIKLGPLADNGGPTPSHALQSGSLAIDAAGTCLVDSDVDQRGQPRPGGTTSDCDAGAFEFQGDAPEADLAVELSSQNLLTEVGGLVVIQIQASQNGPHPTRDVSITIEWPEGLEFTSFSRPAGTDFDIESGIWEIGAVDASESLSMTLRLTARQAGLAVLEAEVTGERFDPVPANNLSELIIDVRPASGPTEDRIFSDGFEGSSQ
ncbi:MAG: choice-of-anchor Q domain-containing protein [Wenzhouxiangella sp.]|jgi:CSLREA domain-containing protein|nr:choice-of-anchor Q domain-containing protein [Wenzhouxiangella sp.]